MVKILGKTPVDAPSAWRVPRQQLSTLHQIAPYIGKLKPAIARDLVKSYTAPGELVLDCFAGSGTIPLECLLLGRNVIAADNNAYAIALTRAKIEAPPSLDAAVNQLYERLDGARRRPFPNLERVPEWVRKFFHPKTLGDAIRFADECLDRDDQFLLGCLLGILHHQRPGFLSYPSSHLVPYLRDRKYPRSKYPELYGERDIEPRLLGKIKRIFKNPGVFPRGVSGIVLRTDIAKLELDVEIDAVITSPPYMNALDYVRDNRLRMWFLDRSTEDYSQEPTDKRGEFERLIGAFCEKVLSRLRQGGRCVLIVGETVRRKRTTSHPAAIIGEYVRNWDRGIDLEEIIVDEIPDVRRSRRNAAGTKRELIMIMRRC